MTVLFFPSLQLRAAVKIAIAVCNHSDVRTLVAKLECPLCVLPLDKWEETVRQVIATIIGSKILQDKIISYVRPVSLEMDIWRQDHAAVWSIEIDVQNELCWKSDGTIDRQKTAEAIVRNENIDIGYRFALASFYCLDSEIRALWPRKLAYTPQVQTQGMMCKLFGLFRFNPESKRRPVGSYRSKVVDLWTRRARDGDWSDRSVFLAEARLDWMNCAVSDGNSAAIRYILENLPEREVTAWLLHILRSGRDRLSTDVVRFCLSLSHENQQLVWKRLPRRTLQCILSWPSPELFTSIANQLWGYLSPEDFFLLLHFILYQRIIPRWTDINYLDLLVQFWEDSPPHFKEFVRKNQFSGLLVETIDCKTVPNFLQEQSYYYKRDWKRSLDLVSGAYSDPGIMCAFFNICGRPIPFGDERFEEVE